MRSVPPAARHPVVVRSPLNLGPRVREFGLRLEEFSSDLRPGISFVSEFQMGVLLWGPKLEGLSSPR